MSGHVASARRGALMAVSGACLWGTTGTSQALLAGNHTPVAVGALRAIIGALALTVLVVVRGGCRSLVSAASEGRWKWLLFGGAAVAGYQLAFFAAVAATGVGVGTLVMLATSPGVAGLTGWVVQHERPTRRWAVATLVGLAGGALLVLGSSAEHHVNWAGLGLAMAAGACFALYSVAGRVVATRGADGMGLTAWVFIVAGALLSVPLSRQPLHFLTIPRSAAVVAWIGVVTAGVAYLLYQSSMRHIAAATAATLALAEPMVANVLAVVVLHEPFTWVMGLGIALVLGGLALLGRS